MYDSIIFDLDGTLWDSTPEVAIAFNHVLKTQHPEVKEVATAEILRRLFGRPLDEIGVMLFQSVSEEHAKKVIVDCCKYENEYLAKHGARLYEGLEDTLRKLSKRYKLCIVSNCQAGYIEAFFEANPSLKEFFIDFECPGNTGKLKADNIRLVMERNQLTNSIYVGDTIGDANSSKKAGVPFIYARYGFGTVEEYDMAIDSFGELLQRLEVNA